MCEYKKEQSSGNVTLAPSTHAPEDYERGDVCGEDPTDACRARYQQLKYIHDQAEKQWKNVNRDGRNQVNSVIFNVFIFCQMFNFVNARKLNNDYNIFEGIHRSYIFLLIWAFILGAQVSRAPPPLPLPSYFTQLHQALALCGATQCSRRPVA